MKQATTTLLATIVLAGFSFAGPAGKAPMGKGPVPPPPIPTCNCFEPGGAFSLYAAAFVGSDKFDDAMGAGLSASYFFTQNLGLEADATWGFTDSTIHTVNASAVLRFPITSLCLAPYILAGGGLHTNGVTEGTAHLGAGIDVRLKDCFGVFADARYTWADEAGDYTVIRAGVRMNF